MSEEREEKIWRYMDLAKFVMLLATRSLHFSRVEDLIKADPFEGMLPRSYVEAESRIMQMSVDALVGLRKQFPPAGISEFDALVDKHVKRLPETRREASARFGVSCWHRNDDQSDAMWKLYSAVGQGVAIESTIENLKQSLTGTNGLIFDVVRYADFDSDPIDKGHHHYGLFIKRKSFEHEKEFRATLLLSKNPEHGQSVPCDLNLLITAIHISPTATPVFESAVRMLCEKFLSPQKPIQKSSLLEPPNYSYTVKVSK